MVTAKPACRVECALTSIVDTDSIACEMAPDPTTVEIFVSFILAVGYAPYNLPVWEIGLDEYELFPTATNAAMLGAIRLLAENGTSPDRLTVMICPNKEHAAVLSSFIAEWE
jgi:hypothetical protein